MSSPTAAASTAAPTPRATATRWHATPVEQVLAQLETGPDGLTGTEAARRRAALPTRSGPEQEGFLEELVESFTEPLQLLLVTVAVLSAVFGELRDAVAIAVIVVLVAVTETLTETRSARAIAALGELSAPTSRVVRDGQVEEVAGDRIVAGDVVALEAGDLVPADLRVLSASGLRVQESALTGEPAPVGKDAQPIACDAPLAERSSMLYAGTAVVGGAVRAVVVAVGDDSELGRLGRLVDEANPGPTSLQRSLREVARAVLVLALVVSVAVPLVGLAVGQPAREMLLAGLSLAFATVPEELPILVTVLLAVAGRQLARRGALLRRLSAAEALGGVSVVVTDKTGTLTRNELTLVELLPASGHDRDSLLRTAVRSQAPAGPNAREPLETSLADAARQHGLDAGADELASHVFDAQSKLVTRVWVEPSGRRSVVVAGAPESVLARCALTAEAHEQWQRTLSEQTGLGRRLVAFAQREVTADENPAVRATLEQGLSLRGLAAFEDPLRDGVPDAVSRLHEAGVSTVLLTGDHPSTASAVAVQAGLPRSKAMLGGDALEQLSDADLLGALRHGTVLARATPADKLRVVRLLRGSGQTVAVTGDGVNDGPALAAADVGIAMGRRGSDLARQAAGVVLVDDAFPTVATAVASGRNVGTQLRRAVGFYLGAKLALVLCMLVPLLLGRPVPFTPAMIALLELFMDLGASVAFVAEPAAATLMRRPPRAAAERFLDRRELTAIGVVAAALTVAVLPAYLLAGPGAQVARAAALGAWLAGHALIAWSLRADPRLALRRNLAFPAWALAAVVVGLTVAATPLAVTLGLSALDPARLGIIAATVLSAVVVAGGLRRLLRLGQL